MAPELSKLAKRHLGSLKVVGGYCRVRQHVDVTPVHCHQAFPTIAFLFHLVEREPIGGRALNALRQIALLDHFLDVVADI